MTLLVISPTYYPKNVSPAPWDLMFESALRHKIVPLLYGLGKQMETHGGDCQGTDVVALLKERSESHVMYVDCRDILFVAGEEEIMEKFDRFNAKWVVSTERNCWPPDPVVVERSIHTAAGFDYLNVGAWIAEREYVIEAMQFLIDNFRYKIPPPVDLDNPTVWLTHAKMQGLLPDVSLDRNCEIFMSMMAIPETVAEIRDGRVFNSMTGSCPCVMHFNGAGSWNVDPQRNLYRKLYGTQ